LRFRRNAEKTRKAGSSTRLAGKKEREGQICGGFATQIPSETHMITSNVRVKIPTARSEKNPRIRLGDHLVDVTCIMFDPFLEPSLLIRRFEILKRTSTIGLKPKCPPYFGMVNFMIIRGRYDI